MQGKWVRNREKQNIFLKFRDTFCYLELLTTYRISASSFRENVDATGTYIALCIVNSKGEVMCQYNQGKLAFVQKKRHSKNKMK